MGPRNLFISSYFPSVFEAGGPQLLWTEAQPLRSYYSSEEGLHLDLSFCKQIRVTGSIFPKEDASDVVLGTTQHMLVVFGRL